MRNIAIIPARSGSKGLKDKNIRMCAGKPLIAYTIEAAKKSSIFDCIHVSTDSTLYSEISEKYGAECPFLRSRETSSDTAGSWEVVLEVLHRYEKMGRYFDTVTLLQPTSPLRDAEDIKAAYERFIGIPAKAIVSVCEMDHSPLWCNVLPKDGSMAVFLRAKEPNQQRQTLPKYYRINGAIYMVDCGFLKENGNIYREGCFSFIMEKEKSIDIDTEFDFVMAEYIMKKFMH